MEKFLEIRSALRQTMVLLEIVNIWSLGLCRPRLKEPLMGTHEGYTRTGQKRLTFKISY